MSTFKNPRAIAVIQSEYQALCTRAGHTQYQLSLLEADLKLMNDELKSLNLEAAAAKEAEDKAKAEAKKEEAKDEQKN